MIARKKVSISIATGEVLSEEIVEVIDMKSEDYWKPLLAAIGPEIIEKALCQTEGKSI